MRRALSVVAVALAASLIPSLGVAGPTVKPAGPTVGEFVTMAANAGGVVTPVTTDAALRALERLGIAVSDPDAPLSQGMLARIMGGLGYQVVTHEPGAAADSGMTSAALGLVGSGGINPLGGIRPEWNAPPTSAGGCLFGAVECLDCCLRLRIPLQGCARFCSNATVSPSGPPL